MLRLLEHRDTGNHGDLEAALPAVSQRVHHLARVHAAMQYRQGFMHMPPGPGLHGASPPEA